MKNILPAALGAWGITVSLLLIGTNIIDRASARGTRLEKHILNHSILVARDDLSSADRYSEAGVKKAEAGNYQGALADFNTAIKLNPRHAKSYNRRGGVKYVTYKDNKGSLADFNKAIELDPNLATAYSNRCALKMSGLTDYPGALADCNRAIELDPKGKDAYNNRGLLRFNFLQDKAGGIADFEKIVPLLQKENKTKDANTLRGRIKKMKLEVNKVSDTRRSI
jgi:tetratricopeptide (TPR) repeat protein